MKAKYKIICMNRYILLRKGSRFAVRGWKMAAANRKKKSLFFGIFFFSIFQQSLATPNPEP